uniref:CSON007880 protein n=1 Tax=Culicoides sonorensis TaxID=179676 RepID=A0A336LE77_CULSO
MSDSPTTNDNRHICAPLKIIKTDHEIFYSCRCCAHSYLHTACSWMCHCTSPLESHTLNAIECYPDYFRPCGITLHNIITVKDVSEIKQLINDGADVNQRCFIHGTAIIILFKCQYELNTDFYDKFYYFMRETNVDVKIEDRRGRTAFDLALTNPYLFKHRKWFKEHLMHLTYSKNFSTNKYEFKDVFRVGLLSSILLRGGDREIIDEYYKENNKYFDWIEQIWTVHEKCHILCVFLHESIRSIADYEFEYMKFLEIYRRVFIALKLLYNTIKRKRLFYQVFFHLIKIGFLHLSDRHGDDSWARQADRFDRPNLFERYLRDFMLQVPLTSTLFNHLNAIYYIHDDFTLDTLFVTLYQEFNSSKTFRTKIPNTEQKLLDFLFPFITRDGMKKMMNERIEYCKYGYRNTWVVLNCFEFYAENFFPFDLYKEAASLKCTYKVQPFKLKRITRDFIRQTVYEHDSDPNKFIRNISSLKCLPRMLKWYLRFVLPGNKI